MENRGLTFKAKDRAVDVWFVEKHTRVIDEVARGEIIGAVDDNVVFTKQVERVRTREARLVGIDANLRIHPGQAFLGGLDFGAANVAGGKRDLTLEISEIDDVEIDHSEARSEERRVGKECSDGGLLECVGRK